MGRLPHELAAIPAADWADLEAFDAVEPIGGLHAEILHARLSALLASAHFKRARRFTPDEFLPFAPPPAPQAAPDLARELDAALTAYQARRTALKGAA